MPSISPAACPFPPSRTTTEKLANLAKDVLFVSIGFGVIGVQKAQVRRRELTVAVRHIRQVLGPDAA